MKAMIAVFLAVVATASYGVTISGEGFDPTKGLVSYSGEAGGPGGNYSAVYDAEKGCASLSIDIASAATEAWVKALGPFGRLRDVSMSFEVGDQGGTIGNGPYAGFDLDYTGDGVRDVIVISMGGNEFNGNSYIHVVGADNSYWNYTLSSIYDESYGGVKFGDMTLLAATVYIGNWPSPGKTKTADITSITVVPEPATVGLLALGGLSFLRRRNHA